MTQMKGPDEVVAQQLAVYTAGLKHKMLDCLSRGRISVSSLVITLLRVTEGYAAASIWPHS